MTGEHIHTTRSSRELALGYKFRQIDQLGLAALRQLPLPGFLSTVTPA